jgi:cell division septation protein DedD
MTTDDQSHYEISLTAGQAFIAFVLLLLSLAASFAFGLMIGRGQGDDRLIVRKEPAVVTEASLAPKKAAGKIVELGVADNDFQPASPATRSANVAATPVVEEAQPTVTPEPEPSMAQPAGSSSSQTPSSSQPAAAVAVPAASQQPAASQGTAAYAQLLSTADQKTAESLAAKLINAGYTAAYVERGSNDKGAIFRVRIKFASESDARAAEPKLKEFSKDVWIVH